MTEQHTGPPKGCAWIAAISGLAVVIYVGLVVLGYVDVAKVIAQ